MEVVAGTIFTELCKTSKLYFARFLSILTMLAAPICACAAAGIAGLIDESFFPDDCDRRLCAAVTYPLELQLPRLALDPRRLVSVQRVRVLFPVVVEFFFRDDVFSALLTSVCEDVRARSQHLVVMEIADVALFSERQFSSPCGINSTVEPIQLSMFVPSDPLIPERCSRMQFHVYMLLQACSMYVHITSVVFSVGWCEFGGYGFWYGS